MYKWQQDLSPREWTNRYCCEFCEGINRHSCSFFDCRDAVKKAAEYYKKQKKENLEL